MKIATWNVNSLRVRLDQVLAWLAENPVDVLGIQETKLTDANFPKDAINAAGYAVNFSGQPTYNGVALLTRMDTIGEATDVVIGNPLFEDEQQRLITGTCNGLRVTCAYIPNGQDTESPKYEYKLKWLDALIQWLGDGAGAPGVPRALVGDYNIAPADDDVHEPRAWAGKVLCSEPERARFERLLALGLVDTFRLFEQAPKTFSWWDYRRQGFRRNAGLRIDHVLVDASLQSRVKACVIDKTPRGWEQPSDHTPVITELTD
jgi:exodeoxyribonuclease-3